MSDRAVRLTRRQHDHERAPQGEGVISVPFTEIFTRRCIDPPLHEHYELGLGGSPTAAHFKRGCDVEPDTSRFTSVPFLRREQHEQRWP
jgi:hypothetical protein